MAHALRSSARSRGTRPSPRVRSRARAWTWARAALALGALAGPRLVPAAAAEPARPVCDLGLAQSGGTGLFDLPLADAGCPWRLHIGTSLHGSAQSDYLTAGDRNTQLSGTVQAGATLGQHVEAWFVAGVGGNRNQRPLDGDAEGPGSAGTLAANAPTLALGSIALGLKLHSPWGARRGVHVGGQLYLRVHSGPDDFGPNLASLDFGADLLGSVDLRALLPRLPLRLHARAGYLHDRSSRLLANFDCSTAAGDECLATRLIYTAAYGIGQPRVLFALGADARFQLDPRVALGALVAYHLDAVVSGGDPVLLALLRMQQPEAGADARVQQWLTLGARLYIPLPMTLELGVQLGLMSAGYAMGAKLPIATGYGALSWELDLTGGRREPSPAGPRATDSPRGTPVPGGIRGLVRDAGSATPLADAVVRFVGVRTNPVLTDEHGEFRSGPLPPGAVVVEVSRGDHEPTRSTVHVRPGETSTREIALAPAPRVQPASLLVALRGDAGPLPPALVSATLSQAATGQVLELHAPAEGGSDLLARAPAGTWVLRADAAGYLAREQLLVLTGGSEHRVSLRLTRRPSLPRVQLGDGEILLGEPLVFAPPDPQTERVALAEPSGALLDELIDLLVRHPELRHLRIEYGTPGGGTGDSELLERQVIAVRDYLVQRGVAPERVVATEAGSARARARRISFKVAP